jgi:hypothetical protein
MKHHQNTCDHKAADPSTEGVRRPETLLKAEVRRSAARDAAEEVSATTAGNRWVVAESLPASGSRLAKAVEAGG